MTGPFKWLAFTALLSWAMAGTVKGEGGGSFQDDFSGVRPDVWQLGAGGTGKATVADGRLTLDLSQSQKGKWATADLYLAIRLPARIEWDQCLAHNSQWAWFCGATLWSPARGPGEGLQAGIGGGAMGNCVFLMEQQAADGRIKEGGWVHISLQADPEQQTLVVSDKSSGETLATLKGWQALGSGPLFLRFFQNDRRLGPDLPDSFEQDRGVTWIDNLRIAAVSAVPQKPSEPVITYPYKVPIVFNRAMRWLTQADGLSAGCIAYDAAGRLALTGKAEVSRWLQLQAWRKLNPTEWPEQPNIRPADEESSDFLLPPGENEARFALRAFQFNTEQHPEMEWRTIPRGVEWRLEVTATDGGHPFANLLWEKDWSASESSGTFDLVSAYRASGRPNRYAEVDVILRLRRSAAADPATGGSLRLRLGLNGAIAIVPRAPVVAQEQEAREGGVLVEAVLVGAKGRPLTDTQVRVEAEVGRHKALLMPVGGKGVRLGVVRGLVAGNHPARLTARDTEGHVVAMTSLTVSVTSLDFVNHYDRAARSYCTEKGEALGPLVGDLFAWVPYAEMESGRRWMILGQGEHRRLIEEEKRPFSYWRWRSLPRKDVDSYVNYMASSGVRVIRLAPNVNPAEYYLDAGGHVAPHGLEQVSYVLDVARRYGARVEINLFHYPYLSPATGQNPPVWQIIEAGYPATMAWTSAEMWLYQSAYLDELLGFTGADPAVMAYTINGENDQSLPVAWVNQAYDLIKSKAPRQMVVLEQGGSILECRGGDPAGYAVFEAARDGGVGVRAYATYRYPNDCFMAVIARFYATAPPGFLGEVACGINTKPGFVTKYRDAMGIATTLQQPMAIAWSAAMLEEQCRAFTDVARQVDWSSFSRARAPVAVIVEKPDKAQLARMAQIEEQLSSIPIDYEYVAPTVDRAGYALVLDARTDSASPAGVLPDAVMRQTPLIVSKGNHCTYALSADRRRLLAYIRNAGHYELGLCDIGSVETYRLADRERDLRLELKGFPKKSRCRVWDAERARLIYEGNLVLTGEVALGRTAADVLVLVSPE